MSPDESDKASQPPGQVLSYRRPPKVEPSPEPEGLLGCLATSLLVPVGTVLIAFASYATRTPGWVSLALVGTLFVAPLTAGLALRKSQRWRALSVGLLFGLGIAALIEGICLIGTMR